VSVPFGAARENRFANMCQHGVFLFDEPLADGATPDLPDNFDTEIAAAFPISDEAPRRSPINWDDLPQADDDRLRPGEIALALAWFAAMCGLAWCFYRLFVLAAEVW
jgi:hypothetical protein